MRQFITSIGLIVYIAVMLVSCMVFPPLAAVMGVIMGLVGIAMIVRSAWENRDVNEW